MAPADRGWVRRSRLNPWLIRAVLAAGGVLVAVVAAELSLRVRGIGYGSVHIAWSDVLRHEHPRDYRFVSYKGSREYGGHTVFYDEEGRLADPDGPRDQGGQRVIAVVTGDSFVEALQVTHEDSFVSLLQDASPGPEVFSGTVVEADRVGTR